MNLGCYEQSDYLSLEKVNKGMVKAVYLVKDVSSLAFSLLV
jgi:hypothetical protein